MNCKSETVLFPHIELINNNAMSSVNKQADEIPPSRPSNGSVFSMEVEVPRLLGTEITWADMGTKRNRLKLKFYLF